MEAHAEEAARHRIPERRGPGFVDHAAQFGNHPVAEPFAVQSDEQIAAACEQQADPSRALAGMQEQPADLRRAVEVGDQVQRLGPKCPAERLGGLAQSADAVAVERPFAADLRENLAGADNTPAPVQLLGDEHEQIVRLLVRVARRVPHIPGFLGPRRGYEDARGEHHGQQIADQRL